VICSLGPRLLVVATHEPAGLAGAEALRRESESHPACHAQALFFFRPSNVSALVCFLNQGLWVEDF
jgi:hypothetical protein